MPRALDVTPPRPAARRGPVARRPQQRRRRAVRRRRPRPAGARRCWCSRFGGPEGHDDVLPFLENVTRGRGIPRERLEAVAEHYHHFGGVSPINEQNKALIAALEKELAGAGIDLPVYWGNRNWAPYVEDTWRQLADDGIEHVYVLATSAYASFSGCRQYHEDIARARVAVRAGARPRRSCRTTSTRPGFVQANAEALAAALASLPAELRDGARLVATAHSIPDAMAAVAGPEGHAYEAELTGRRAARSSTRPPRAGPFDLVWQSRSGPPSVPWLEPDVNDHLRALAAAGERAVVALPGRLRQRPPRGDLGPRQRGAGDRRRSSASAFARAATAGTHPAFVDVAARAARGAPRRRDSRAWARTAPPPAASSRHGLRRAPRPAEPAQAGDALKAAVDGLADRVGQRAQRVVPGRRLGVGDGGARRVGHRQVEHLRQPLRPGRAPTARAGRGPAAARAPRSAWPGRRAAPGTSGCQRARSSAGERAGGVADREVERPGHRAQGALRPAAAAAARPSSGNAVHAPPRARAPRAPGPAARRRRPAPHSSASAASPGARAARGRRRATGSTSRKRRSPSPRSAVSAQPSGTASSVPGSPATRCAVSPSSASRASS